MINNYMHINSQIIAKQKRIEKYNLSPKKCAHCDDILPYDKRHSKYCDHSCAASHTKNRLTHGKCIRIEKECIICRKMTSNPKICSEECRKVLLSRPRKYKTEEERIHARRMMQRESYARYAAKKKYQTPVDADLTSIKLFYQNCPKGYEVDHITPISKGGLHSIENLQYLTISENRQKHANLNWNPRGESDSRNQV
jgi:hypothetical protein